MIKNLAATASFTESLKSMNPKGNVAGLLRSSIETGAPKLSGRLLKILTGAASLLLFLTSSSSSQDYLTAASAPQPSALQTGWNPQKGPLEAAIFSAKQPPHIAKQVAALAEADSDADALNYRFLAKLCGVNIVPSQDQKNLGSCVGFGTASAVETVYAADILHRKQREIWKCRVSGGGLYALSRTIAGQNDGSEGSTGAWAMDALQKGGVLWEMDYGGEDLTTYDVDKVRLWQTRGIPALLIESSKKNPVRGCFLLKNVKELKSGLQNGYAASICAAWSFVNKRDSMGFAKSDGRRRWNHCMSAISYRGPPSGKEGYLIQNSWADRWISGPRWPADQPDGSFWITPAEMQDALRQGDSWLIGSVTGFQKRDLSWAETLHIGGKE